MTLLSIIIPASGSQSDLDETLLSVLENRPDDSEVICVHPASYQDPYDLGDEVRFLPSSATGVLDLFNAGFEACQGSVVHTLSPGISITEGWTEEPLELFAEDRNLAAVAPTLSIKRQRVYGVSYDSFWSRRLVRRHRRPILAPVTGTGFYLATALRFMHGFDVDAGVYADVDLGLRLLAASYKTKRCRSVLTLGSVDSSTQLKGYRAGQTRRKLFQTALGTQLASPAQNWQGVMAELFQHGLSAQIVAGLFGRVFGTPNSEKRTVELPASAEQSDIRKAA